jgi:hypothetical protein
MDRIHQILTIMGQVLVVIKATPMKQVLVHMVVDIKLVIIQLLKVLAMEQGWGHIQRMELAIQDILVAGVNTANRYWVRGTTRSRYTPWSAEEFCEESRQAHC